MNAIELLQADHEELRARIRAVEEARSPEEKRRLYEAMKAGMEAHIDHEENVFFPALSEFRNFENVLEDCLEDLNEVKDLLSELTDAVQDEDFDNLVTELADAFEIHVREEELELFPRAHNAMLPSMLQEIAGKMVQERKREPAA